MILPNDLNKVLPLFSSLCRFSKLSFLYKYECNHNYFEPVGSKYRLSSYGPDRDLLKDEMKIHGVEPRSFHNMLTDNLPKAAQKILAYIDVSPIIKNNLLDYSKPITVYFEEFLKFWAAEDTKSSQVKLLESYFKDKILPDMVNELESNLKDFDGSKQLRIKPRVKKMQVEISIILTSADGKNTASIDLTPVMSTDIPTLSIKNITNYGEDLFDPDFDVRTIVSAMSYPTSYRLLTFPVN